VVVVVLQTFAEQTMGVMQWLMPILIAISVIGTINGTILSMSRSVLIHHHFPPRNRYEKLLNVSLHITEISIDHYMYLSVVRFHL
jgi:hypothetical protein